MLPDSYKILRNDWPYGVDERIVHLVVWLKFSLPSLPISSEHPNGDLTPTAQREIETFVDGTFARSCGGGQNVLWFWNWRGLKSVHAVEHFHVMLFDPDPGFVERITGGDVAMAERYTR